MKDRGKSEPARSAWGLGMRIIIIGLFLSGTVLIATGIWINAQATLSQVLLDQSLDRARMRQTLPADSEAGWMRESRSGNGTPGTVSFRETLRDSP